jgi:hypothetical protein
MYNLLDPRAREPKPANRQREPVRIVRTANGGLPIQDRSKLRWLDVTVRMIDSRRGDLELTHWKKVWRSVVEDGSG